jgi:hypothetical protein
MRVAKRLPDLSPPFQRRVMKHSRAAPRSGSMKLPDHPNAHLGGSIGGLLASSPRCRFAGLFPTRLLSDFPHLPQLSNGGSSPVR